MMYCLAIQASVDKVGYNGDPFHVPLLRVIVALIDLTLHGQKERELSSAE